MLCSELTPTVAWAFATCATVLKREPGMTYSAWLPGCICDESAMMRMSMGWGMGGSSAGSFTSGAAKVPAAWARTNET